MIESFKNPVIVSIALPIIFFALKHILRELNQHSLILYTLPVKNDGPHVLYRLFLQNAEDTPLRLDWVRVTAEALTSGGALEKPDVFAGPHPFSVGLDAPFPNGKGAVRARRAWVEFHELPAHDTWVIEWRGNEVLKEVCITIREVDNSGAPRERRFPTVNPIDLRVRYGEAPRLCGPTRSPSVRVGTWSVVAACAAFWLWRIAVDAFAPPPAEDWWMRGILATIAVLIGGLGLLYVCQRPTPSVIQGYLDRSLPVSE